MPLVAPHDELPSERKAAELHRHRLGESGGDQPAAAYGHRRLTVHDVPGNAAGEPRRFSPEMPKVSAPTFQLLAWVDDRSPTYAETIDVWKTSCPRLAVWEDALADDLVRIKRGRVVVTATGRDVLTSRAGLDTVAAE